MGRLSAGFRSARRNGPHGPASWLCKAAASTTFARAQGAVSLNCVFALWLGNPPRGPSFWLRPGRAAKSRWRRRDVRISRLGGRLLDRRVHLSRMEDTARLLQLVAQVLLTWGERRLWSWRRVRRLRECRAGHERDPADQQAKWRADNDRRSLNWLMHGPFPGMAGRLACANVRVPVVQHPRRSSN